MRKLASIQRVVSVEPIANADAIEKATVLGWECVVKKSDSLRVGDLCVYIEIDSICPDRPIFEFLRDRKMRVRTIKLRGQISQGLALPLSYFPEIKKAQEGDDVTTLLGITKFDPEGDIERRAVKVNTKPNPLREFFMQFAWFRALHRKLYPSAKRGWPEFIRKTDETRIQNYAAVLKDHAAKSYYATEKIDGQSASYFLVHHRGWMGGKATFGVCSRNLYLKTKHACTWWSIAESLQIERILKTYNFDLCVQGEIVGPGVQGNKYGLANLDFYVFNVWDITTQSYLPYSTTKHFCEYNNLKMVPIVGEDITIPATVPEIVEMAKGKSILNPKVHREGLVIRTMNVLPNGEPVSFKAINPDFLLKYDEVN